MVGRLSQFVKKTLAMLVGLALLCSSVPAQEQADYTFRVQSDLVLVNVTVKDKSGSFVRGLKPGDFTILEDNKPQKVVSFDVENIDAVATQDVAQAKPLPGQSAPATPTAGAAPPNSDVDRFKDRRLIVLFFDLSAMEPDEIDRALSRLEMTARERGVAVGISSALPVSIGHIAKWAKDAQSRGLLLVPVSAVAVKAKQS